MSKCQEQELSLKPFNPYDKIKTCRIEREVEDVYNEGIAFYFSGTEIKHPFDCDGYISTKVGSGDLLKMIIEYKYNEDMKQKTVIAKILVQVVFYLKRFEDAGMELPNVVMVGDINECFVMHSNDLLKYLEWDVNWKTAPSDAFRKCPDMVLAIAEDEQINPYVFWIDKDFDFKDVVVKIHHLCENVKRYVRITEHNIASIFEYFRDRVLLKKDTLTANEAVSVFIGLITNDEAYYIHPKKKNTLITPNGNVPVNGTSFVSFFNQYAREYTPQERMNFTAIADRLLEDTTRRRQGCFNTPTKFVDFAHRMIEKELGENWRDEFVVYDCCCGTGNLTRDYLFKELYCSTLDKGELELGSRYNPEATKWQMDFLNDGDECLDRGLIRAFEQNKLIVFFINPPYGTAGVMGNTGTSRKGTNNTSIRDEMNKTKFGGSENLQHQFMYRITKIVQKYNLTNAYFALFSKPIWLSGSKQGKFLKNFSSQWECKDAYLFQASHFADVSGAWGISLTLWKSDKQATPITEYNMKLIDILDDGSIDVFGNHTLYNASLLKGANDWCEINAPKTVIYPNLTSGLNIDSTQRLNKAIPDQYGQLVMSDPKVAGNQTGVLMLSSTNANAHSKCISISISNFTRCTALFTARKLIEGNWINDKDEYLAPNEDHPEYKRFEADATVYSLFHNSSNQTSMRKITYKGKLYDIPNEFFWMSRDRMTQLANENNNAFMFNDARTSKERYVYTLLNNPEISSLLSPTAKQLLDMATAMMEKTVKYRPLFESDHSNHHIHTWDAGYYQLKDLWKEYLPEDFKIFRNLFKQFGNELRPLVYELGFLRK
mgnify:CR=1 FL=1